MKILWIVVPIVFGLYQIFGAQSADAITVVFFAAFMAIPYLAIKDDPQYKLSAKQKHDQYIRQLERECGIEPWAGDETVSRPSDEIGKSIHLKNLSNQYVKEWSEPVVKNADGSLAYPTAGHPIIELCRENGSSVPSTEDRQARVPLI